MKRVWRFNNKYGVRTLYGVVAESPEEVFNSGIFASYKSYFLIPRNRLKILDDKSARHEKIASIMFEVVRSSGAKSSTVLEVPAERSEAKLVPLPSVEDFDKMVFVLPYQLPYQAMQLEKRKAAKDEGYTSKADLEDLRTKRTIAVSWATDGLSNVAAQRDWMTVIESCPSVMEGEYHSVFCGACKNIFNKLTDSCTVNFLDKLSCIMGLNTSRDFQYSESHGDYGVSAGENETASKAKDN